MNPINNDGEIPAEYEICKKFMIAVKHKGFYEFETRKAADDFILELTRFFPDVDYGISRISLIRKIEGVKE